MMEYSARSTDSVPRLASPSPMSETHAWTTVSVALPEGDSELSLAAMTEQLELLAALLAERDEVGGVEVRDPACIAEGPEFVAVERPELVVYTTPSGRESVLEGARVLAERLGLRVVVEASDHEGDDWRDAWKRYYQPLRFEARGPSGSVELLIRPSWIARSPDDPERELILDPGRAFGTGLHESTRLCLRALVEHAAASSDAPRRVFDLGCGSGILGLAAARLWPASTGGRLVFADHDPEAVETARENAELNGLAVAEGFDLRFMSLDLSVPGALSKALAGALGVPEPADLILANIRPSVLIPCASELVAGLAPGGTLILSGILDEEGDAVRSAYAELELCERPRENDWCALVLRRRG
jgi:ribosomal protein L11 methyltransferase